jgi:hypothetical protein
MDYALGPEQVREGKREGTASSPEIGPGPACRLNSAAQEIHMVCMVHRRLNRFRDQAPTLPGLGPQTVDAANAAARPHGLLVVISRSMVDRAKCRAGDRGV